MIVAAVTAAGFTVTLSGRHTPAMLGADVPQTADAATLVPALPAQSPPIIRAPAGLAQIAAPLGAATGGAAPAARAQSTAPSARTGALAASATTPAQGGTPPARETPTVRSQQASDQGAAVDLNPDTGLHGSTAASRAERAPAEPTEMVVYHKVQPGDTVSTIAQRYGVSTASVLVINEVITDRDLLKVGQTIQVPTKEGVLYFVRLGDTVTELAEKFGAKVDDIVNFGPNKLTDANAIREGELILIPGGHRPAPPPPPPPPPPPRAAPAPAPAAAPARPPAPAPAPAPVRPSSTWIWPITGPLSSYFGPSHPLGIDIDLYGRAGTPITAARGGVVTFAGGNPCCSYGYYVEIDHGDGFRTRYGHFQSPPPVRIGQQVAQGQVIGYAGTTGYSTGVHLHFEIRRGGVPVNPLAYLP